MPKLTIITICYNIVNQIERTLKSIVRQTFQDFEWIVVDGASIDGTLEILQKYVSRINILISEKDKGIYDAMNKGILKSKGEYLLFLNGGDELNNIDSLKDSIKYLNQNFDLIVGNTTIIDNDKKLTWASKTYNQINIIEEAFAHSSSFIKRELLIKYNCYDLKYNICADYDFFVKLFKKQKVNYQNIDTFVSTFYCDGLSNQNIGKTQKQSDLIRKKYFPIKFFFFKRKEKITELFNCIRYPRYFLGKIKKIIKK